MHDEKIADRRLVIEWGLYLRSFSSSLPSDIKARDKEEQEKRKCTLPVGTLTEDESFQGIKEAPSLIIPW